MRGLKKKIPGIQIGNKPPKAWSKAEDAAFYHTTAWRKLREYFLQDHVFCVECERKGRKIPATVVDHIQPISQGGEKLDESNLRAMCARCHNSKSARESKGRYKKRGFSAPKP